MLYRFYDFKRFFIVEIVAYIKATIKNRRKTPPEKLLALTLLKELMDTKNKELCKYVCTKIMKRLGDFGLYKKKDKSPDRGKTIFSRNPSKEQVLFLRLILECIESWQKEHPFNYEKLPQYKVESKFVQVYKKLTKARVTFPEQKLFFVKKPKKPEKPKQVIHKKTKVG